MFKIQSLVNKKSLSFVKISLLIFFSAFFFSSCIKDLLGIKDIKIEDPFNPSYAVPLVHAKISVFDMLKIAKQDSIAKVDPDNFIRIIYTSNPQRFYAGEIINVPMQYFKAGPFKHNTGANDSIRVNLPIYFFDKIDNSIVMSGNEELSKLHLKSGKMIVKLRSTIRRTGEIEINITGSKLKNGNDFIKTIPINYSGSAETFVYDTIDLSGCKFDLSLAGTTYNKLQISYTVTMNQNANYIRKTDELGVEVFLRNLEFSYIEGYLGQPSINYLPDSILIDLLKNLEANNMKFYNPSLNFFYSNSAGIPVQISNQNINSYASAVPITMSGTYLSNPIDINYPSLTEIGQVKKTTSSATRYNSNVRDMINQAPSYFTIDMDINLNQGPKKYDNFLTDSSFFEIVSEINLPLYGTLKNYNYEVYLGVDSLDMEMIELIQLNLLAENSIPLDMNVQIYLADSSRNVLDSVVESTSMLFKASETDTSGKVVKMTKSLTKIIVSNDKIASNPDLTQFIIKMTASSADKASKDIKVYTSNRLDLKVSLFVKLKIDL